MEDKKGISGSTLKIIAILAMLTDHFGAVFLAQMFAAPYGFFSDSSFDGISKAMDWCHDIGSIAFPIYCFLLVEGFVHTHDVKKYLRNLLLFAVISEPIYDWAFFGKIISFKQQNVLFELALVLLTLIFIKKFYHRFWLWIPFVLIMAFLADTIALDGGMLGILLGTVFYVLRDKNRYKLAAAFLVFVVYGCVGGIALFSLLVEPWFWFHAVSLIFIALYNGKRGLSMKYFFYGFYPGHLLALRLIGIIVCFVMGWQIT